MPVTDVANDGVGANEIDSNPKEANVPVTGLAAAANETINNIPVSKDETRASASVKSSSKDPFLSLPSTDESCLHVDEEEGLCLWIWCSTCEVRVKVRSSHPFTMGDWNDHKGQIAIHQKS